MTALNEYQRLESTGLWRERPGAQRREVMVSFGDATLVISDTKSDRALTHWSLPAVERLNPGKHPALYAPGPDIGEELEIENEMMVKAIDKVHTLIEARKPHPGRLRIAILGGVLAAVVWLGLFWVPDALIRHTARIVPFAKRQEIGHMILTDLTRLTGQPCEELEGTAALEKLRGRFGSQGVRELHIMPAVLTGARHLPGAAIVLGRDMVEDYDTPEVAAGYVLAERARADWDDPLDQLLRWAGYRATFRLLTTGEIEARSVDGYAEYLLTNKPAPPPDGALLALFKASSVPSSPYAFARDATGETTLALIEADPMREAPAAPLLDDGDWVALQGICGG